MSGIQGLADLQRRYEEIRGALDRLDPGAEGVDREQLRQDIITLFRETERQMQDLSALRDSIRPLVDRYRELFPARPTPPPAAPGRSVRVDHLGSSTHLERGWNAIAAGSYDDAIQELEKALSFAPGSSRAEALLGWALMRRGRLAEARGVLEPLLAREPDHDLARTNLGYVCMREGRVAEAIEHLSRSARSTSDRTASLYAHLYLGMIYSAREMYRDARGFLEQALEIGPNLIEAHWELGGTHYREGNQALAGEAWRRGVETNRFNPWGDRCRQALEQLGTGEAVSLD